MYLISVVFPNFPKATYHDIYNLIGNKYKVYTYKTDNDNIQIGDKLVGYYINNPVIIVDIWEVDEEDIDGMFSFEVEELKIKQIIKYLPPKKCLDKKCSDKQISGFKSFI